MDPRWKHPWTSIVCGPTGCGKTVFVKRFIKHLPQMSDTNFAKIIFHYGEWQSSYDEYINCKNIEFREGLPGSEDYSGDKTAKLVIIDDLMREASNNAVINLFTKGSHHKNLSVIFLTQNIFHQGRSQRDISLNANYIVIFKNPRDRSQIQHLARQVNPENTRFLQEIYYDATSSPHGYLLLDLKQSTPENCRFRSCIFPDANTPIQKKQLRVLQALCYLSNTQRQAVLRKADPALIRCICSNIEENVVQQEASFENSSQMLDTSAASDESLIPHHSSYEVIIDNSIIESVPKKLRSNCARVLKRLRKAPTALISWDDRGCVTIKGRKIPHSNITDLVNDIIRPRRQAKAIGRQQFAKVLQTLNIPREFIGNRAYFNNVSEEEEKELSTSTPTRRRSGNITIPEIITENVAVDESMLNQSGNGTLNKNVLSKHAWAEPLINKTSVTVAQAFSKILSRNGKRKPRLLQTDSGKEFLGAPFQELLRKKEIQFRTTRNPDIKASIVERINRTIKERIWRYFTHTRTKRYLDVLQKIMHAYNHTVHSGIKMAPVDVNENTAQTAYNNLKKRYENNKRVAVLAKRKLKYSVGDLVRISKVKAAFTKGYESGWSSEIFKILRISNYRQPAVYILIDLQNEPINGIFYEEELSKVE
ncbi:uncharacterized protein LOC123269684 [Cotesia glomerata]|uniref:uncharacterized protein LOC123269684 n=1 Tax=Cotesia glomerata TaxID=32391 RepID=UPI001D01502D|nr:uncharacterized protein LOC123269684 [Cotesia glomerata]